jgi:hypothetical protein
MNQEIGTTQKINIEDFFAEDALIQNVVDLLDEDTLSKIYQKVSQKFDDDKSSMGNKIDKLKSNIKIASLISERDKPFQGASDVVFPLVANACIQYGSTAYQALFPDDEIVKSKIIGSDKGKPQINALGEEILDEQTGQPKMQYVGKKAKIGDRITTVLNYQINEEIPSWKKEAIKAMYRLPVLGTLFEKSYWDFVKNKLNAYFVFPDKIIINPNCTCIEGNIYSEIIEYNKSTIVSNIKLGLFIDYDYEKLDNQTIIQDNTLRDDDESTNIQGKDTYEFVEQHTYLDLDNDGLPEPYNVIFDINSQIVVRIVPDFDLEGIKKQNEKIYDIERNESLVEFGFLPDFAGSFYSIGYAELLENNNASINTSINQIIDSAHLSMKGAGFINSGIGIASGALTFKMGEYKKVNVAGGNLAANVFPIPFPEPSPVLFSLLGLLIESGKELGSLRDVVTGDTAANMAPTTYMGLVEQGMKQSIAILKNNHESFKKSFKIKRRLNAKYLPREKYAEILDIENPNDVSPKMDFSEKNCDIVLVSDSTNLTSSQKLAKAQLYQSLFGDPFYDQLEIRKLFNEAVGINKLNEIVSAPEPTPDANLVLAQAEDKKAEAKLTETQIKAEETAAKINEMAEKLQLMYADIKLKESETIKNISDAFNKEKEVNIKEVVAYEKAMIDRINSEIQARNQLIEKETKQESKEQENGEQKETNE